MLRCFQRTFFCTHSCRCHTLRDLGPFITKHSWSLFPFGLIFHCCKFYSIRESIIDQAVCVVIADTSATLTLKEIGSNWWFLKCLCVEVCWPLVVVIYLGTTSCESQTPRLAAKWKRAAVMQWSEGLRFFLPGTSFTTRLFTRQKNNCSLSIIPFDFSCPLCCRS